MSVYTYLKDRSTFPSFDTYQDKFYFKDAGDGEFFISIPEITLGVLGDDDDYLFINNNTAWYNNGTIPSEFKKNKDTESLIRIDELDPWAKWLVLSWRIGIGEFDQPMVKKGDEDYFELVKYPLLNEARKRFNSNTYDKALISKRIKSNFNEFLKEIKKDDGNLSDEKLKFFKEYSTLCTDTELVGKLRVEITKRTGKSDFIAENFGVTRRFDFSSFSDEAQKIIRKRLGGDTPTDQLGNRAYTGGKPVTKATYTSDTTWYYAKNSTERIRYTNTVAQKFPDLHNRIKGASRSEAYSVPIKELRESDVYSNAVSYDVIEGWSKSVSFYELNTSFKNYGGKFKDLYDPTTEEIDWWFDKKNKTTGPDDVAFVYFLKFIYEIKTDIEDSGKLTEALGTVFDNLATQAADYILPRVVRVFEQNVRISIADFLSKQEDTIDEKEAKEAQKQALDNAYQDAKQSLNELELSDLKKDDLSDEDISDREKKYKQCVLLLNLPKLKEDYNKETIAKLNKDKMHSDGLYNKRFTMIEDRKNPSDQNSLINKLIIPKAEVIRPFLNMTNELYAALVPKIRLYKVYFDPSEGKKNPYITREIPFKSHTSTIRTKMLRHIDTFDKGDGYGIKSFNFSFDGETPATSTKFIKAKLELYFQTFADFAKERTVELEDGSEYKFRYVDLFVNTKFCPRMGANEGANTNSPLHYDPSHYRIRADVGWEMPSPHIHSIMNRPGVVEGKEQLEEALRTINKSFYLNLIDHDINIGDDGTVTISADYIAYIEGAMGTRIMNALLSRQARQFEQDQIKKYEELLAAGSCDEKQLSELRAAIQGARVIGKQKMYQSLTEKLIINNCLYSCFVDKFDRKKFSREQFFLTTPKLNSIDKQKSTNANSVVKKVSNEIPDNKTQEERWGYIVSEYLSDPDPSLGTKINFFYFADLVYFLLDSLYVDDHSTEFFPEVENIKVILTSFAMKLLGENDELLINIGQIPVDLDTFINWYKTEILDKEIEAISVIDFIKRFFLYLVKDIFQEVCVNTGQHKRLTFKTMSIMADGSSGDSRSDPLHDLLTQELIEKQNTTPVMNAHIPYMNGKLPLRTSSIDRKVSEAADFYNYMTIFVHYRPDKFTGLGIKHDDETRGVYHFFIGADKGLVKKINFSKSDIQYIRESRMMNQGTNNLLQLSSMYRCSINMIGNTLLYPGMEIFVNPFGFGGPEFGQPNDGPGTIDLPNLSNIMGIGGYQQVVKVNSTISPGKFETTVDAIFIHSGEKQEEDTSSSPRGFTPNRNRLKDLCSIDSEAIDTPESENSVIDCNQTIIDVENLLLDYSRTGTIDSKSEES